ncbi:hypothetical protein [Silvimonas amylolytica]|uniref:Uncharacterized protein n=1 Tax=Silvimonas amylolytica TaxID=449663 RepID=A0ABQ2PFZ6_9NEIS|nr:hypothetical protein [Silvimonas amylolytica]GGP24332.1 hypothetical protein GCM10010971_01510 [Silvimonas amylolytica]
MMIEPRGSGRAASITQLTAIRAKPGAPQARFNPPRYNGQSSSDAEDESEDVIVETEAATPTPPPIVRLVAETSTQVWLRRLQIENRIAPQKEDGAQGRPAATPASVYGQNSVTAEPAGDGFIEKG